jgi:F0F1-type ATP synthase alpha subunit
LVLQAIDVLTPLGRGQAQLLTGPPGSGKTLAAVDAILGQVTNFRPAMSHAGITRSAT